MTSPALPLPGPDALTLLRRAEVTVAGRILQASNVTLYCQLELDGVSAGAVYKPVSGERPLWDFPTGTLAGREVAAYTLSAATGWDYRLEDAVRFGNRTAAILRAFNLRCGIGTEVEYPSARYGSQPVDGPPEGHDIRKQWDRMLDVWYETVNYDRKTGKPKRDLLRSLDLGWLEKDLYGKK